MLSRRVFLYGSGAFTLNPSTWASAQSASVRPLKILQWMHFVPGYDDWFLNKFVPAWGVRNSVDVVVDRIGLSDLDRAISAEAAAGQGHDLIMVLAPPALYEEMVIDHRDIHEECVSRYGKAPEFVMRSTRNPATGRLFGFCTAYVPALLTYRRDLWEDIGTPQPNDWDEVRRSGRRIKLLHGTPVGLSLAAEHNGEHTLRAILASFGGSVQDENGHPVLDSTATREAVKFVRALYQEAMTEDVLGWNPTSNNTFMLSGECSLTVDTLSIARAGEAKDMGVADKLWLAPVPEGPAGRFAPSFGIHTYFIWQFADNIEPAKQFLVDYIAHSRDALLASGFQNMPSFGNSVPDLPAILSNDPSATRPEKYDVLASGADWTTNIGFPGHTNAAAAEVLAAGVVSRMFSAAATDRESADEAVSAAAAEIGAIYTKRGQSG